MEKYVPSEQSITQELYQDRLGTLFNFFQEISVDGRLVGSFGRAASINQGEIDVISEFKDNRDIDVLLLGLDQEEANLVYSEAQKLAQPFILEEHFRNNITETDGRTFISYKDLSKEVNPLIFEPKIGQIFNLEIPTLDPTTHFHLGALYGYMRPKDFTQLLAFGRKMRQIEDRLPDDLFAPFHELNRMRSNTYPFDEMAGDLRWLYHTKVPPTVRRNFSYITEAVWHRLKRD